MKKDLFEETKIRMIMKLKKLSHSAAVEEIARMDAARREDAEKKHKKEDGGGVDISQAIMSNHGASFMSAEEFFGEE